MRDFGLLGNLSVSQKRALIGELRNEIALDKLLVKKAKEKTKAANAAKREANKANRIAKLQAKLDALMNPVGAKAIKANRKAGAVTIVKA